MVRNWRKLETMAMLQRRPQLFSLLFLMCAVCFEEIQGDSTFKNLLLEPIKRLGQQTKQNDKELHELAKHLDNYQRATKVKFEQTNGTFIGMIQNLEESDKEAEEEVNETMKQISSLNATLQELKLEMKRIKLNGTLVDDLMQLKGIIEKDFCSSSPCVHGVCRSFFDGYNCHCSAGFKGLNCDVIDDCPTDVCGPHGVCVDMEATFRCECQTGYGGHQCEFGPLNDCYDIKKTGPWGANSGVYTIGIRVLDSFLTKSVYCDMDTDGGGWTVFQRRYDGSLDFHRSSQEYVDGFGDSENEHWMGLQILNTLTSKKNYELRVDMTASDGTTAYQKYGRFYVGGGPGYVLSIGDSSGTAGDSMSGNNGFSFRTRDNSTSSCISNERNAGGWWYEVTDYERCGMSKLNGKYRQLDTSTPNFWATRDHREYGLKWTSFRSRDSMTETSMKIRASFV